MTLLREVSQPVSPLSMMEDSLIALARIGDQEAFAELYRRNKPMVAKIVQSITKNYGDTDDIVQETFSRVYLHLRDFDGRSRFSTWVTRIAINCAFMLYRKRKRLREESLDVSQGEARFAVMQLHDPRLNPESRCIQSNIRAELASAVANLPPVFKQVMKARLTDSHGILEIAKNAGLSVPATKSRLLRATRHLKRVVNLSDNRSSRSLRPTPTGRSESL